MGKTMFKYQGDNQELFRKQCMDDYDSEAVIIVPDTHCAIVLKDGRMMTTLDSGSHEIFDVKKGFFSKPKKIENHTVDVIYMSKTYKLRILWGTKSKFDFRDILTDLPIKVGACGEFTVQISNPRKAYLELIGANQIYTADKLKDDLINRLLSEIEPAIARTMREKNISYDRMSEYKNEIAKSVYPTLNQIFEEEYGLKMFSFIISNVVISDEDIQKIERELTLRKNEKKEEEKKLKEKLERKEEEAEIERLDDKDWERKKFLEELKKNNYEQYLEVCKAIGWEAEGKKTGSGAGFCTKCGHSYENGAKFCPGCGNKVGESSKICPKCNKVNSADSAFCSGCGTKLN